MSTVENQMTAMSALQQFTTTLEQETATTLKLLKAYPESASELKPTPVLKNARELAYNFAMELNMLTALLRNEFKLPPEMPQVPAAWNDVVKEFETSIQTIRTQLAGMTDEDLMTTATFFTGPGQTGEVPKIQLSWMTLCDQIHHRGQFSVYMRMAGAKVPSIYGPSADEPWM